MKNEIKGIQPRWEWRIFGKDLKSTARILAACTPENIQFSSETYLLSGECTDNIKIRNNTLDIKRLIAVNNQGFEQWTPILKASFPLEKETVISLFQILSIPLKSLISVPLSLTDFSDLLSVYDQIVPVRVKKRRRRYTIHSCIAEYSEVFFNKTRYETIALEHTEVGCLEKALGELGWEGITNKNYLSALKDYIRESEPGENNGH